MLELSTEKAILVGPCTKTKSGKKIKKGESLILLLILLNTTTSSFCMILVCSNVVMQPLKPGKDNTSKTIPVSTYLSYHNNNLLLMYCQALFQIISSACTWDSRWSTHLLYSDSLHTKLQLSHLFEWGQSDKVGKAETQSSGKYTKVHAT